MSLKVRLRRWYILYTIVRILFFHHSCTRSLQEHVVVAEIVSFDTVQVCDIEEFVA